jgi:hypothetical protein
VQRKKKSSTTKPIKTQGPAVSVTQTKVTVQVSSSTILAPWASITVVAKVAQQ